MKRMIQRVLASLGLAASSCAVRPGVPLRSVSFHESPHIILRGNEYFLRYRIAAPKQSPFLMRRLVYARKTPRGRSITSAGVRYDFAQRSASIVRQDFLRLVRSGQLASDACGSSDADPVECASRFHSISASVGGLYRLTDAASLKLDLSTAARPPNPDEQYLNGTAPTFPVLGLGKPDLGVETTYSGALTAAYRSERVTGEVSAYANRIADYIYFAPALDENGKPIFDVLIRGAFPRFVTRPVDAVFYGADGGIAIRRTARSSWARRSR